MDQNLFAAKVHSPFMFSKTESGNDGKICESEGLKGFKQE